MTVSLLVADVDGTLVNEDKLLTQATLAAVARLDAAGIAFAITSGRPARGLSMLVEPLKLRTPIASFNGGRFVDPDMTVIAEHVLAPDVSRRAVDVMQSQGLDVWVFSGQDWLIHDAAAPYIAHEQATIGLEPTLVRDFGEALGHAVKIVGVSGDPGLLECCEVLVQAAFGRDASASRSQTYFLDLTHPEANKGAVVTTLSKLLGIPPTKIATIGDMPNDVLMFSKIGLSIAMGNASPQVQRSAHHVTASNREDGFAVAVERFVVGVGT